MARKFQPQLLAAVLAGSLYGSLTFADDVQNFQLPAGRLDEMLLKIGRQSGQIITFGKEVGSFSAPAIQGQLSAEQAVRRAIQGTGLQLQVSPSGALVVLAPSKGDTSELSSAQLAPIDVRSDALADESRFGDLGFQAQASGDSLRLAGTPQREMPMTVNAVTQEVLRTRAPASVADAVRQLPGVSLNSSDPSSPSFTIRGFRSTAIYVNGLGGTPVGGGADTSSGLIPMEDIERVEVLKGPTSILTGASASGGAINVATKQPTDQVIRDLTFGYGSWNQKKLGLDLGGPLGDLEHTTFRLNLAGSHADENYAGYNDPYYYLLSPSVKWDNGTTSVLGGIRYYKQKTVPQARTFVPRGAAFGDTAPSVLRLPRDDGLVNRDLYYQNETLNAYTDFTQDFGKLGDLVGVTFENHLSVEHSDFASNSFAWNNLRQANGLYRIQQTRTEAETDRVVNQSGLNFKLDSQYVDSTTKLGVDYKRIEISSKNSTSGFTSLDPFTNSPRVPLYDPAELSNVNRYDNTSRGYYVIQKFDLFDRVHLFGQKRRDEIDETYRFNNPSRSSDDSAKPRGDSWVLGAAVDVTEDLTFYGNRSVGYVPSVTLGYDGALSPPEKRDQREIGARLYFFDQALTLTASYYELQQTNVVICDPDPNVLSCFDAPSLVVPGQMSKGYELELQGQLTPGLELIASFAKVAVSYQDAGYSYPFTSVPRYTGSLWATYRPQTGVLRNVTFGGGVSGNSSSETNYIGTGPQLNIPGFVTLDALVGYDLDRWSFQFKVNNLANKYYYQPGQNSNYITIGEERNFLLSARYSFD